MITEGTATGGSDLPAHVADTEANEIAVLSRAECVPGATFKECHQNLLFMSIGARTAAPLWHAFASPSITYTEEQWEQFWEEYEGVFGLAGQPFYEAHHLKIGVARIAPHRHRVYLRVLPNRRLVSTAHSYLKNERIARWAEYVNGERMIKGRFNLAVAAALEADGHRQIADAMAQHGLLEGAVPTATRPYERRMTERAQDLSHGEVCRRAWVAWRRTDGALAFRDALAQDGLHLACGAKVPVVVTSRGVVHPLLRAIKIGAKASGQTTIRKADLSHRLGDLALPDVEAVKANVSEMAVLPLHQVTGLERTMPRPRKGTKRRAPSLGRPNRAAPEKKTSSLPPVRLRETTPAVPMLKARTPEQMEKLLALDSVLRKGGAAKKAAAAVRTAVEKADDLLGRNGTPASPLKIGQSDPAALRDFGADLSRPAAGCPGWREAYKARLAGLPSELGARIRWVERECDNLSTLTLHGGERIRLMIDRATGTEPSDAVAEVMVAHALAQGWPSVEFSGGTPAWRETAARLAARRGIPVVNEELAAAVADEQEAIRVEHLHAKWRQARDAVSEVPEDTGFRRRFIEDIRALAEEPNHRSHLPAEDLALLDLDVIRLAARDATLHGSGLDASEFEAFVEGKHIMLPNNTLPSDIEPGAASKFM